MLITVLVFAACVAVLGAVAMRGTDGLRGNPFQAALMFVVLPLFASFGFMTLASISGG